MGKIKVVMNKPIYLGQAILDLSKIIMYEFHYDYMKQKYNNDKLQLCYMDIDSLVYRIKTENFYADITDDIPTRFDTSGYCFNRPLPVGLNKKVTGLMKDELEGAVMTEFIALRPKLYSFRQLDSTGKTRNVKESKSVSSRKLSHLRITRIVSLIHHQAGSKDQQMSIGRN